MLRRALAGLVVLAALAGCGGSSGDEGPTATIQAAEPETTTTSTAEALTPEEEVEQAYLKSWEIYAEAVRQLDDSRLGEAFEGDPLSRIRDEVRGLAAARTPIKVQLDHNYTIELANSGVAVVHDRYVNRSVYVDPDTGEPTEAEPNDLNDDTFTLREVSGRWIVTDIVRRS